MQDIVDTLCELMKGELENMFSNKDYQLPPFAVLPKSWEDMIPELKNGLGHSYNFVKRIMCHLYWTKGDNLSAVEVYTIVTDTLVKINRGCK